MEGLAIEQSPQWSPEEGDIGQHVSVIVLLFLS